MDDKFVISCWCQNELNQPSFQIAINSGLRNGSGNTKEEIAPEW